MQLKNIEVKIAKLRVRYAELDEKLVPLRDGIIDGVVSKAMAAVDGEIERLMRLREKALVEDVIEPEQPAPQIPARRSPADSLPLPIDFPVSEAVVPDPLEDFSLASLPTEQNDLGKLWSAVHKWAVEEVNNGFCKRATSSDFATAESPVRYTLAQHFAITQMIAGVLILDEDDIRDGQRPSERLGS